MSAKIVKTEKIEIVGEYCHISAAVVDDTLSITITYPGSYREDGNSETISNLDHVDVRALYDFLGAF